ncbi:MAG: arginine--tRNA ligase [Candidatus Saccharimonadales bacterium]
MREELTETIKSVCDELFGVEAEVVLTRPDEQFGDYATNVAMQLAKKLGKNPREVAQAIVDKLAMDASVAGPGFINIRVSDAKIFAASLQSTTLPKPLEDKVVVAEYSDPNAFKVLHGGHLYTSLVGDAIANIVDAAGATVHRVNFGGDVGLHVAKTMWAIIQELGGEFPQKLTDIPDKQKLEWVSARYVVGNNAYDEDETAKTRITEYNKRVYAIHSEQDKESPFAQIYWLCRKWSYEGFDVLYERLGMHPFEKYYPESSVFDIGLQTVKEHIGPVYVESDGAVVFRGEPYGLFTQVFINSEGLPTYAGKDVGLIQAKYRDYAFDISFMITDVSQKDHIAVVLKSIEQFKPELAQKTVHYTHGRIKLAGGEKMSSRKGNILRADDIINASFKAAKMMSGKDDPAIVLGAIRYSFLRSRVGGDIVYVPTESVSMDGNSGPYLQYALVRARSILRSTVDVSLIKEVIVLDESERSLARKIGMYPEAFAAALADYSPHHICNYLYELAVIFNRFYEQSRVIDHERSAERVALVRSYEQTLSHGLSLLGMPQPEQM